MKLYFNKALLFYFLSASAALVAFQNCSKTQFSSVPGAANLSSLSSKSPMCDMNSRPAAFEYLACLAPNASTKKAVQNFDVTCDVDGKWNRSVSGIIDYSLCGNVCDSATRPSDVDTLACPENNSANNSETLGVQNYKVTCAADGAWSRSIITSPDFSLCPATCNLALKPAATEAVACLAPHSAINSAVQNYSITCNRNGTWSRNTVSVDYASCPVACDNSTKPTGSEPALCPGSGAAGAVQNYSVTCAANGAWQRVATNFQTTGCAATSCNSATKPPSSEIFSCQAPYQASPLAIQNYNVMCSGQNWVISAGLRDESLCPKACAGVKPADGYNNLACTAPNSGAQLARQHYSYICDSSSGNYTRIINEVVDYNQCPKSCAGTNPAASPVAVACPAGYSGSAYQHNSASCNTATGQWSALTPTYLDKSQCTMLVCNPATKPANYEAAACPAPFQSRMDAQRILAPPTCVAGVWQKGAPTGLTNTTSCAVNDCSSSYNTGTEKDISACPAGATGRVFQSCSLSCTGTTYSQTSCGASNYSRCDCGAGATFNSSTRACVANAAAPQGIPACPTTARELGRTSGSYTCQCSSSQTQLPNSIWGSDPYTDDSGLCKSAVHAGKISTSGGTVTINFLGNRSSYSGSYANGISTSNYDSTWNAYSFGAGTQIPTQTTCTNGANNYPACNACAGNLIFHDNRCNQPTICSAEAEVCSAYTDLLKRYPDKGGAIFWSNEFRISKSKIGYSAAVAALRVDIQKSAEYAGIGNTQSVISTYDQYNGDMGMTSTTTQYCINGMSCVKSMNESDSLQTIRHIYAKHFKRAPDPGGLVFWENRFRSEVRFGPGTLYYLLRSDMCFAASQSAEGLKDAGGCY